MTKKQNKELVKLIKAVYKTLLDLAKEGVDSSDCGCEDGKEDCCDEDSDEQCEDCLKARFLKEKFTKQNVKPEVIRGKKGVGPKVRLESKEDLLLKLFDLIQSR